MRPLNLTLRHFAIVDIDSVFEKNAASAIILKKNDFVNNTRLKNQICKSNVNLYELILAMYRKLEAV